MEKKIFIAGHRGLVGSALLRFTTKLNRYKVITKSHDELDLTNYHSVVDFLRESNPDWVLLAAAKVGGIKGNDTFPVEFLLNNLKIQNNVIESAYSAGVKRLLFLGSSCIYPKHSTQPIKEEYLLSDYLEPTNKPYAIAKIAGIELCSAYNRQYGTQYSSVMPCNLYGPNDNYDPEYGHALPMLLRRFHEAKINKSKEVVVWGSGEPYREFMFSDDLAEACFFILEHSFDKGIPELINIGSGLDIKIKDLALMIKQVTGFEGRIVFDITKPDGTYKKLLDVSRINSLGWESKTSLREGLEKTYKDFLSTYNIK